ncbi:hypothetical protein MKZ38_001115 [Zalerion maritima]|uniref:tRNA-splicing endonuclease subunit Sen54 N-terminal domain-containing protein n=1 Tax=Zalerion maritima TaxID=339359 RepID=A0AAD5RRU6_9PEZI|nr:hypothetical protein MKZ38_001115 [Zalerion maritima]
MSLSLDDENDTLSGHSAANPEDAPANRLTAEPEDDEENEEHDIQKFVSLFDRRGVAAQAIRRGEKDFESHGTRAQENILEASRQVLEDVLAEPRYQNESNWTRGWYFPDWWGNSPLEEEDIDLSSPDKDAAAAKKRGIQARDRVVVIDNPNSAMFKAMGRVIPGLGKDAPGADKLWLFPEEALFLVDRGSLDLWYPTKPFEAMFPVGSKPNVGGVDDYEDGFPLTQEAAYALFLGAPGERGKISLEQFQVFANLKRTGYNVTRAPQRYTPPRAQSGATVGGDAGRNKLGLWAWMMSLLFPSPKKRPAAPPSKTCPLIQPGLYRDYKTIHEKIAIIPRHKLTPLSPSEPEDPYKVLYFVWQTGGADFSKTHPPPPDFYMAVVDARQSPMPTLDQISNLLRTTPWSPPREGAHLYPRLKHGYRHVVVAAVDQGVINYYRFGEGAFEEELIFARFDYVKGPSGGQKTSGRGRGGGRGGRGGKRGGKRGGRR